MLPENLPAGPDPQVYVLRLWRQGNNAHWRVTLRDAGSGALVAFVDLDELMLFLLRATQPVGPGEAAKAQQRQQGSADDHGLEGVTS